MTDAIIFDLDGTLWNANTAYLEAWNNALAEDGIARKLSMSDLESVMGLERKQVKEKLFSQLGESQWQKLILTIEKNQHQTISEKGGNLYPFVFEGIQLLAKKHKLFIVSNCDVYTIPNFIKHSRLDGIFIDYESHGNTGLTKAQNICLLKDRHQLNSPVYIGDTYHDYLSSEAAKIRFFQVLYGFHPPIPEVKKFKNFKEISNFFK